MKSAAIFIFTFQGITQLFLLTQASNRGLTRNSCTGERAECQDCETLLVCNEDPIQEISCTDCGFVCGDAGEVAGCYRNFDGLNIDGINTITNSNCTCMTKGGQGNYLANGNYTDPYSATSYITCTSGNPRYESCPNANVFDSETDLCVPGLECPSNVTTPIEYPLNCNAYVDCPTGVAQDCDPTTEIFDINNVVGSPDQCIDPLTDACSASPGPGVMFTHHDVCYLSLTCDSQGALLNGNCCPRGQYYDDVAVQCTDDNSGVCNDTGLCIEEYWEQSYCNECVDENTNYATREICSKYFYNCANDGGGGFIPELNQCPPAYPYFDPDAQTCKVEADITECQ